MRYFGESHILRIHDQGADSVVRLVARLADRLEEAEARLLRAPQPTIELLSKELARAKRTLACTNDELRRERQLNHQLLRRVRELEAEVERATPVARDSHNSSLPPSLDPPWRKVTRTRSLRKKSVRKSGGQFGHRGMTLKQSEHPDHLITYTPEVCRRCGAGLHQSTPTTFIRRQVFDISEGRLAVTEHRAEKRRCRHCAVTTTAEFPPGVRAPARYGKGLLSRSVYLHLYQLLPVARTSETMRDLFGCHISAATIERAARVSSGKLVNTEQRIKAALRDSSVVGVDETGLRVARRGGYVHVARTEALTHYAYDERRGKAAMDEIGILPQYRGTLVRDGFSSYKWYERCLHSLCNVHLLRDLVFVAEVDPAQAVWTAPLSKLLLKIKDAVARVKAQADTQLNEQTKNEFLRRYDKLVNRADRLNPPPPKRTAGEEEAKHQPVRHPTPRTLINRLQRGATRSCAS